MKLARIFGCVIPLIIFSRILPAQQTIPFDDKRWSIRAQGHLVEYYQGYQALYLQNGMAYLGDEPFSDGIIEFDIFLSARTSFSGMIFRMQDRSNYEELYLRSQLSGYPDAYQYTPVFNDDPAWQLYHDQYEPVNDGFIHFKPKEKGMGYNGVLNFSFNRWTHVKLLVKSLQAELYLDHSQTPSAFISKLGRGLQAGGVGVKSLAGACWFANFSVVKTGNPGMINKEPLQLVPEPGTVMLWKVSGAFRENRLADKLTLDEALTDSLKWINMAAEDNGLLNLALRSAVTDSTNTIIASLTITADKDLLKKLDIGYSDRIRLFLNGQIVYGGSTGFRSRDYKYLGTIGYFDAVYLSLKRGRNTLLLAISEDFGGWGLKAKLNNMDGIGISR